MSRLFGRDLVVCNLQMTHAQLGNPRPARRKGASPRQILGQLMTEDLFARLLASGPLLPVCHVGSR